MALNILEVNSYHESTKLDFVTKDYKKWLVLCPNPVVADAMRTRDFGTHEMETLTINKYLSDFYNQFYENVDVARKSELLKILWTLWKVKYSEVSDHYFSQAFELYTDLRSFTLNDQLIDEILDFYPEVVSGAVRFFWVTLREQNIIDEHQAYANILEKLQDPNIESDLGLEDTGIVIQGFTHLSASQIELFKYLGKHTQVVVPIPKNVMNEAFKTDWVDWIKSQTDEIYTTNANEQIGKAKVYKYTSGSQAQLLKRLNKREVDIVLPIKNVSLEDALTIPRRDLFFKAQHNIFTEIIQRYRVLFEKELFREIDEVNEMQVVIDFLNEKLTQIIRGNKSFYEFAQIKLISQLKCELISLSDLHDVNESFSYSDFELIFEVLELNLPRTFNIPVSKNCNGQILGLGDLHALNTERETIIIAGANNDLSAGNLTTYTKEVSEILITLGPIRRKGLDASFHLEHIKDICQNENTSLLLEAGSEEHIQAWAKLNEICLFEFQDDPELLPEVKKTNDKFKDDSEQKWEVPSFLSATRMQTFLECPKKYFYGHLLKLGKEPERVASVDPRELGKIEHSLVQEYLAKHSSWNESLFKELLDAHFLPIIETGLNENIIEQAYTEIKFFSKQTILELIKIKTLDPEATFEFEYEVDWPKAKGDVDVVVFSKKLGMIILDLKRSGGSIPSKGDFTSLKKIQVWYYHNFLKKMHTDIEVSLTGYVNLSDPKESLIFSFDEDLTQKLQEISFLGVSKIHKMKDGPDETLESFEVLFEEVFESLKGNYFPADPQAQASCLFCPGTNICDRGVSRHG